VTGPTPFDIEFRDNVTAKLTIKPKDSAIYIIPVRPKGAGQHESVIRFRTDEGPFGGTLHLLKVTSELDSVVFRLMSADIIGGFGEIVELPVEYQPILEGRIPLEELTLHANFNPKMLDIVGLDPQGTLTAGWELVNVSYADTGAVFKIRKGSSGAPLTGTGRLMTLRLKVLRGDSIATPLDLSLAGVSRGCLTAELDSARLFQLTAECAQQLRTLYTNRHLLKQSIPNPAIGMVTIPYMIPEQSHVTLTMFDAGGREVARLIDEEHAAGDAELRFNTRGLAPGTYFYRITVGATLHETRTMVIER
jgi:type IX secretion system substrate protein